MSVRDFLRKVWGLSDLLPYIPEDVTSNSYIDQIKKRLDRLVADNKIDQYSVTVVQRGLEISITRGSRTKIFDIPSDFVSTEFFGVVECLMEEMKYFSMDTALEVCIKHLHECKKLHRYRIKYDKETNEIIVWYEVIPDEVQKITLKNSENIEIHLKEFINGLE